MKLTIRTSSGPYALGLFDEGSNLLASRQSDERSLRQVALGVLLEEVFQEAVTSIECVSEVIVDLGPGGLSSTRVGVAFANALSYGSGLKLSGVSALRMQMFDARACCDTPLVSMRPAPGGQAIWALFEGSSLTASGSSSPDDAIAQLRDGINCFGIVGPMKRLKLEEENLKERIFDIDPPSLESMLVLPKVTPRRDGDVSFLEPINSADGASR